MEHKDIAEVYQYIRANRGVGHTTLLKDGALNATYPYIVIGADQTHAERLVREIGNEFAIPVGINQPNKFRGAHFEFLKNYRQMEQEAAMKKSQAEAQKRLQEQGENVIPMKP